ncbi:MAG TPA: glycosyltransferase [Syntrophomonadaceae bacterium]|nr:glycosyltransferase [Syntrophomonadaceae bacterium]
MKILFTNTAPIIKYGIGQAFSDLGIEVQFVFLDQEESILPFIQSFRPDFVFNDGGISRFHKIFPYVDNYSIPHIYWGIEDPPLFNELSLPYASRSSHIFTPCQESIADYNYHGHNADLLMFACHPHFHRNVPPDPRFNHDILFAGNNYGNHPARMRGVNDILRALVDNQYDIKIYGNEWWLDPSQPYFIGPNHYAGYMANEDLPAACATAKIILGLHSVDTSLTMMSMRTYEVLGSGGFYLTQWTPAIEHQFINHHHLVWTKSSVETFELVNWYLDHPEERQRIARQGQLEVYDKHTYHHRVQNILPLLQITPKVYNIPYQIPAQKGVIKAGVNRVTINL